MTEDLDRNFDQLAAKPRRRVPQILLGYERQQHPCQTCYKPYLTILAAQLCEERGCQPLRKP